MGIKPYFQPLSTFSHKPAMIGTMELNDQRNAKLLIMLSVILIGVTAIISQIILMREFLIVFYGNELCLSFLLANWLICGAIGSWLLGRIADRIKSKINVFALCQFSLGIILILSVLAIRSIKIVLNLTQGSLVPLFIIAISSFIILFPLCVILGFLFAFSCRVYKTESNIAAIKIGKVYILEAVGSIAGGSLCSFFLIRLLNSIQIISVLSLLNILAAFFLLLLSRRKVRDLFSRRSIFRFFFLIVTAVAFITGVVMYFLNGWGALEQCSLKKQWQGYEFIASQNSIYGNIAVIKRGGQISLFKNGLRLYTTGDKQFCEEAVHFNLLEHINPKDVLLIGGGAGGLAEEVLKHPIERVDYVELDPLIINMAKDYFPAQYYRPLQNNKVIVKNLDGRFFIKTTAQRYDSVIIYMGDPSSLHLNRYYTVEFFQEVKKILKKGGIISLGVSSAENYLGKELKPFLQSIYSSLKDVFEDVKIIPGDTAYFLASDQQGALTYDEHILTERIKQRKLNLDYVREYYLFSKLSKQRTAYLENTLKENTGIKINYDFRPSSYFYHNLFWAAHFRDSLFTRIFKSIGENQTWKIISIGYVFILLLGLSIIRNKRYYKNIILIAVMSTGFSQIAFQVIILFSFQIIYGYIFYKIGVIMTLFMAGLTVGGYGITKLMPKIKKEINAFTKIQMLVCVYPVLLIVVLILLRNSKIHLVHWLGANILFPFLSGLAGFTAGLQFPLSNKIYMEKNNGIGRTAGITYGMDLFGSSIGAVLAGIFLIPLLGITKTCFALAIMSFLVLLLVKNCKMLYSIET